MTVAIATDRPPEQIKDDAELLTSNLIDVMTGPTPEQTDSIIAEYDTAKRVLTACASDEKGAKKTLLTLVRVFGHAKAGSDHSYEIHGALHTAVMTNVTTTSLNEDAIEALEILLMNNERHEIFHRLFAERVKHELQPKAEEALLTIDMPEHLRKKVKAAFALCRSVNDSAPRLKVDLLAKEPKQPRKRAAKKAVQA